MDDSVKALVPVALPVIGAVIWLIRLEGRVNTHAALHAKLTEDVTYIRSRIDEVVGRM